jgi:hypothetical protein
MYTLNNQQFNNSRIDNMLNARSRKEATYIGVFDRIKNKILGNDEKEQLNKILNILHKGEEKINSTSVYQVAIFRKMVNLINKDLPPNKRHIFTAGIKSEGDFRIPYIIFSIDRETCAKSRVLREEYKALTSLIGEENEEEGEGLVQNWHNDKPQNRPQKTFTAMYGRNILTEVNDNKIKESFN